MESAALSPTTTGENNNGDEQPSSNTAAASADRKVLNDLEILLEKMRRCDDLLRLPMTGALRDQVPKSDEVMSVIGFLEACAPRMVELVEAAAQGALSEPVLMQCLDVNDRLTKNLADIDAVNLVDEDVLSAETIQASNTDDDFDAFLNDRASGAAAGQDLS